MSEQFQYAQPRTVTDIKDCWFYHSMDIPQHGSVTGQWNLRKSANAYLGGLDLGGKRVLEMGAASGFLCFHMESCGAEVVAFDIADDVSWDIVPLGSSDALHRNFEGKKVNIHQLKNGYWFTHRARRSQARVVYGNNYAVPLSVGPVDVVTFGCILLHLRDPMLALTNTLRLVRQSVVITEPA